MEFASLVLVACLAFLAGRFAAWPHNVTLYSQLSLWKEEIMATLKQIQDALAAAQVADNAEAMKLKTALGTLDAKVDNVIALIAALKASGGATPSELDDLLSAIHDDTPDIIAAEAQVAATSAKLDGANSDPASPPASSPPAAPPVDDAFVAVGATRISDGQVQTEESLAAAVTAWNAAHPDQQIVAHDPTTDPDGHPITQ